MKITLQSCFSPFLNIFLLRFNGFVSSLFHIRLCLTSYCYNGLCINACLKLSHLNKFINKNEKIRFLNACPSVCSISVRG